MIIKNNTQGIIAMHVTQKGQKVGEGVRELISLKPGVNDVPSASWEVMAAVVAIQHHLDAENLVVVERTKASGAIKETDEGTVELKTLNAKDAIKLVHATFDRKLLERWTTDEDRSSVIDAIERQLDAITLKENENEKDEEDQADDDAE